MKRFWDGWARFWAGVEHPRSMALVRIFLALTLLYDFGQIAFFDLVLPLFGDQAVGGWSDAATRKTVPEVMQWLPVTAGVATAHFWLMMALTVSLLFGFFTRTSAILLMFVWAQQALVLPLSDRGIDMLCRNVLMLLAFSGAGRWASVDAWLERREWFGEEVRISSWPRLLLITQLVVMYFTAGVQKVGALWMPFGDFGALYVILQDPAIARFRFDWVAGQPWYFLSQVGTAGTMVWQSSYPLVFLWYWFKNTPERPGRLRAIANRYRLHIVWVAIGGLFHLLLAVSMELGIFPWAMLAMYPAFVDPDEWKHLWQKLRPSTPAAQASTQA